MPKWSWEPRSDQWEEGYAHLLKYVQETGHSWVYQSFTSSEGFKLGTWVHTQRTNKNKLPQDRINRLETLPTWSWNPLFDRWDKGYAHLTEYAQKYGHCRVPAKHCTSNSFKLGVWVFTQRKKIDSMSQDKKERLEALPGWNWNPYPDPWEEGFNRLKEFAQKEGNCRVPKAHFMADGYKLGIWVNAQRSSKSKIAQDKIVRLEALSGWSWNTVADQWELGLNHLAEYSKKIGNCRIPAKFIMPDGFKLGSWINTQRTHKHKMLQDRIDRLEALPGWSWNVIADQWEEGFNHLLKFAQKVKHSRVPNDYTTSDGFKLGIWVSNMRRRKDKVSQENIDRLEALPNWNWERLDQWEEGYNHLVEYMKKVGHSKVTARLITSKGYKLGNWVANQRSVKDELSQDHRDRLEALSGWQWNPFDVAWEEGIKHLCEYALVEGHCRVPQKFSAPDGYKLGSWVGNQRNKREKMQQERKERLEALPGWEWNTKIVNSAL